MKLVCILGGFLLMSILEFGAATSVSQFACVRRNLSFIVDDIFVLYIDGVEIAASQSNHVYGHPIVVDLPCTTRLIAIDGQNGPLDVAAILASTDDEYILTNSTWKCSNVSYPGWEKIGFDDSTWVYAIEYGHNGDGVWGLIPGISANAAWIWLRQYENSTTAVMDKRVYCRKKLDPNFCTTINPCLYGSTCIDEPNGEYHCNCAPGYTGKNCSTEINYCESDPCGSGGSCLPIINGYVCQCQPGFTGDNCEYVINNCESFPCLNGGTCLNGVNYFVCVCPPESTGLRCETAINYCESDPCASGGSCLPIVNGYVCQCLPGYTGDHCEDVINNCESFPCLNGGTCLNGVNYYVCACPPAWTGVRCDTQINYCESDPCGSGGSCQPIFNGYVCQCHPGYTGDHCEYVINNCESFPCLNGGTCLNGVNYFVCVCPPESTGLRCETIINTCDPNPCLNGGSCSNQGGSPPTCTCPIFATGVKCESPNYDESLACGTTLDWSQYNATNGFTRLCYFWAPLDDIEGRNTQCRNTINGIPLYGDYVGLLNAGGNFGCLVTQNYPEDLPEASRVSCADNYQQDVSLGNYSATDHMMVCLRYPYEGIPGRK